MAETLVVLVRVNGDMSLAEVAAAAREAGVPMEALVTAYVRAHEK